MLFRIVFLTWPIILRLFNFESLNFPIRSSNLAQRQNISELIFEEPVRIDGSNSMKWHEFYEKIFIILILNYVLSTEK